MAAGGCDSLFPTRRGGRQALPTAWPAVEGGKEGEAPARKIPPATASPGPLKAQPQQRWPRSGSTGSSAVRMLRSPYSGLDPVEMKRWEVPGWVRTALSNPTPELVSFRKSRVLVPVSPCPTAN